MEIKKFREAREEMIDQPTPEATEVENQEEEQVEQQEVATTQSTEGITNPAKLNEVAVSFLTERLKDEYTAHYFYRAAANWCFNVNYKKAAAYFEGEASSELEHAQGLQKYMDDWNIMPQIPSAPTEHNFNGLVDIINQAYKMEYDLLQSYNKNSSELFAQDLTTFDFLQSYRQIQNQSVIEYSDLLNALLLIDHNNKFEVLYFEQTYF